MAVLTQVEILLPPSANYKVRLETTKFVSALFLSAMNSFFAVSQTKHRTLSGYVTETRARAFETAEPGFRGLLVATNVRELNEKQWEFFRYMVFEVVHSKLASAAVTEVLNSADYAVQAAEYRVKLPDVLKDVETLRNRYFDAAYKTSTNTPEFKRQIDLLTAKATAEGKTEDQIKLLVEDEVSKQRASVVEVCKAHLKASLGRLETKNQVLRRLAPSPSGTAGEVEEAAADDDVEETTEDAAGDNLEIAIVAETLIDSEPTETRVTPSEDKA
jgi:hypothetical protein